MLVFFHLQHLQLIPNAYSLIAFDVRFLEGDGGRHGRNGWHVTQLHLVNHCDLAGAGVHQQTSFEAKPGPAGFVAAYVQGGRCLGNLFEELQNFVSNRWYWMIL